jgi:hypothetical protein
MPRFSDFIPRGYFNGLMALSNPLGGSVFRSSKKPSSSTVSDNSNKSTINADDIKKAEKKTTKIQVSSDKST